MPNYFAEYDTTVHFISEEELKKNHSGIPHGGFVIRSGKTGWNQENNHVIEYSLKLDSNLNLHHVSLWHMQELHTVFTKKVRAAVRRI